MKRRALFSEKLTAMLLLLAAGVLSTLAAPPTPEMPRSVFILPSSPREGRDPFFPNSDRPYLQVQAMNQPRVPAAPTISELEVESILVNSKGQAFTIINNQTFGVGDDQDVIDSKGRRIHIRCINIDPQQNTVTIASGSTIATLTFKGVK